MKTAEDFGAAPERRPRPRRCYHSRAAAEGFVQGEQVFERQARRLTFTPRFTIPAGTKVSTTPAAPVCWRSYVTKKELAFEAFERVRGGCYEFRHAGWLLLVPCRLVTHRNPEDVRRSCQSGTTG